MAGLFEWGPDPEAEGRRMESLRALYARAPSIDGVRSAENIEVSFSVLGLQLLT